MKQLIIAIHPEHSLRILSGEKKTEIRVRPPTIDEPCECFIYETKKLYRVNGIIYAGAGAVTGEFICDTIEKYNFDSITKQYIMTQEQLRDTCLSMQELVAYGRETLARPVHGLRVKEPLRFETPLPLSEFLRPCKNTDCQSCEFAKWSSCERFCDEPRIIGCGNIVTRPPQSWCWVERRCKS